MPSLRNILYDRETRAALSEVAEYTVAEAKEAGFVVYSQYSQLAQLGRFTVSRVVKGAYDYVGDDLNDTYIGAQENFDRALRPPDESYTKIYLDNLTCEGFDGATANNDSDKTTYPDFDEIEEGLTEYELEEIGKIRYARKIRKDLMLVVHSHPTFEAHGLLSKHGLEPSIPDLENNSDIAAYNPDCIFGIITVEERLALASLLVYRNGARAFYKSLDHTPPPERMQALMDQNGYTPAILSYRYRQRTWAKNTQDTLRDFESKSVTTVNQS